MSEGIDDRPSPSDELTPRPDAPEDDIDTAGVPEELTRLEARDAEPELPHLRSAGEHAPGELELPEGVTVFTGSPNGACRAVAVIVSRYNADVTRSLLDSAFEELDRAGVSREAVTVVPVPGAFELPLAAMAFAKTRRYACVVALGCVIRGETAHFDFVASEAASGLQLAALETGVPVSFGVLTLESPEQAETRTDKGADAVRSALEMADLFSQLRATAAKPAQ